MFYLALLVVVELVVNVVVQFGSDLCARNVISCAVPAVMLLGARTFLCSHKRKNKQKRMSSNDANQYNEHERNTNRWSTPAQHSYRLHEHHDAIQFGVRELVIARTVRDVRRVSVGVYTCAGDSYYFAWEGLVVGAMSSNSNPPSS